MQCVGELSVGPSKSCNAVSTGPVGRLTQSQVFVSVLLSSVVITSVLNAPHSISFFILPFIISLSSSVSPLTRQSPLVAPAFSSPLPSLFSHLPFPSPHLPSPPLSLISLLPFPFPVPLLSSPFPFSLFPLPRSPFSTPPFPFGGTCLSHPPVFLAVPPCTLETHVFSAIHPGF